LVSGVETTTGPFGQHSSSSTAISGYGSPHKPDTAAAHSEPLGDEEIRLCKRLYGWPEDAQFLVPEGVYDHFAAGIGALGGQARKWTELFEPYRGSYLELATEIELMQRRELPAGWDRNLPVFPTDPDGIAGREASGRVLNVLAQNIAWFLGASSVPRTIQRWRSCETNR
jgi:transketolase